MGKTRRRTRAEFERRSQQGQSDSGAPAGGTSEGNGHAEDLRIDSVPGGRNLDTLKEGVISEGAGEGYTVRAEVVRARDS
jgi:hypothetical protein